MVTGGGQCARTRLELGTYLLGAIEPAQRPIVDRHLAACPACRAELSDLAALPSLLRRVPGDTVRRLLADDTAPAMPGPPLSVLVGRIAASRRRNRILAAAAALITGIAVGSGVQAVHAVGRPPAAALARAVTVQAGDPATGVWAAVRYAAQPWGTELEVSIAGIAAGTRCQLLVTGPRGQQVAAGGWYIAPGRQTPWYPASVPLTEPSVRSFQIAVRGKVLVTIPAQ
jgi:anti-sigma factor RsiW